MACIVKSKSIIFVIGIIILLGLIYFAASSKKSLVSNVNNVVQTPIAGSANPEVNNKEINLEITSPKDGVTVTASPISVTGITAANAEVFINDAETKADAKGNFKASIDLDEGENEIFVTANDLSGNSAENSIKVNLNTE